MTDDPHTTNPPEETEAQERIDAVVRLIAQRDRVRDRLLDLATPTARLRDACDRAQQLVADLTVQVTACERILSTLVDELECDEGGQS